MLCVVMLSLAFIIVTMRSIMLGVFMLIVMLQVPLAGATVILNIWSLPLELNTNRCTRLEGLSLNI